MTYRILRLTTLLALGSLAAGCSSNADAICDTRQQCFNDDLDTGACAKDIEDWVEDEDTDDREQTVEKCAECVDGRSCAQVLEFCINDCFGIP